MFETCETRCLCERLRGVCDLATAAARLSERIEQSAGLADSSIRRIEVEIEPTDPLLWAAAQPAGDRAYFRSPEGDTDVAMLGRILVADDWLDPRVGALMAAERPTMSESPCGDPFDPYLLVTRAFDAASVDDGWLPFGCERLALSAVEMRRVVGRSFLAVHLGGNRSLSLRALAEVASTNAPPIGTMSMVDDGDLAAWVEAVDGALAEIASERMAKVVLARTRQYQSATAIDPVALLLRLRIEEPNAFHVCIEESQGCAMVSVSPERLFRREGLEIVSPAIAGTCGRGSSPQADARLAQRLLGSDKDRREHEIVVQHIRQALEPLCQGVQVSREPEIMQLPHVQHLQSRVVGTLIRGCDDRTILRRLHPTPAVCGTPTQAAAEFILATESLSRGHYAGAIGVVSSARSDFAVGIRSALVQGDSVRAYAGAGIVRGSNADAEWLETSRKLQSFDALTRAL